MKATYTKTRNGWSVKLHNFAGSAANKGEYRTVNVTKKSGETKVEKIKIFWVGRDRFTGAQAALGSIVRERQNYGHYGDSQAAIDNEDFHGIYLDH